jgi:hypothetical protein
MGDAAAAAAELEGAAAAELEGAEREHRCSLCPTTHLDAERLPTPPPLENAPTCNFPCGHSAHTHCIFNTIYETSINELLCPVCNLHVATQEARDHYRGWGVDRARLRERDEIQELWDTNAEFKADILEYKAISRKFGKASAIYKPELRQIKERFKQNILTSIETIKIQKRQAQQDVLRLESRKIFRMAGATIERKIRRIERKYNIARWALDELSNIRGAPKFAQHRYYRWRCAVGYLFRTRI